MSAEEDIAAQLATLGAQLYAEGLSGRYEVGDLLGEGRFSKVYNAVPIGSGGSGQPVALKEIGFDTLLEDEEAFDMLDAEVAALRKASSHPGLRERVVKIHELLQTPEAVFLVLDRVPGEELFNVIDRQGTVAAPTVRELMRQLLLALASLHELGIVHRDVKPENLMIDRLDEPAMLRLTLIDFGYAAIKSEGQKLSGLAGSPEYAAPEVLAWLTDEGAPYDSGCDVWSVGVTAHVLVSAELPFEFPEDADEDGIAACARSAELRFEQPVWEGAAMLPVREFVCACMTPDPSRRRPASELLHHRWLVAPDVATTHATEDDDVAPAEAGAESPVPPVAKPKPEAADFDA